MCMTSMSWILGDFNLTTWGLVGSDLQGTPRETWKIFLLIFVDNLNKDVFGRWWWYALATCVSCDKLHWVDLDIRSKERGQNIQNIYWQKFILGLIGMHTAVQCSKRIIIKLDYNSSLQRHLRLDISKVTNKDQKEGLLKWSLLSKYIWVSFCRTGKMSV